MSIHKLDHYSVRTHDLEKSIAFYASALGFVSGPRPSFPFPGAWMYLADEESKPLGDGLVHLIGTAKQGANGVSDGVSDYLGDKAQAGERGTGSLDHIAFTASDIASMYGRLSLNAWTFRERRVPGMQLHQLFVEDPCGVVIELNYAQAADLAAADERAATASASALSKTPVTT
jgi:catechol 2,3-dioxygenase-like lactoylglutathione lyase family enzyme